MKDPVIFHIDLDAFFASVEVLDNPSLKGRPVIVGAQPGHRGVVATCSYEARAFGLRSAMPISEAVRLCPDGVYVRPRIARYSELSAQIMTIFESYSPSVRRVSIDEAFLEMTGTEALWGDPPHAAAAIKASVREKTGLGISIGVAPNHYLAKIASGLRKPDGLVIVGPGEGAAFMKNLPLSKLWGAGEKTQERLREAGIQSIAELAAKEKAELCGRFGQSLGAFLYAASRGEDVEMMLAERESARSLSAETTFEVDTSDRICIEETLLALSEELAYRLWASGLRTRCLGLKLRLADFTTLSRQETLASPLRSSTDAYREALALLERSWDGHCPVRLLGLAFTSLESLSQPNQGYLFEDAAALKRQAAENAVFKLGQEGKGRVTRASLIGRNRGRDAKDDDEPN